MSPRPQSATVDAELFGGLQEAIDFVAALGGGTVYSDLAGTLHANGMKRPATVTIEAKRPEAVYQLSGTTRT